MERDGTAAQAVFGTNELLTNILEYCHTTTIVRARAVSHHWRSVVDSASPCCHIRKKLFLYPMPTTRIMKWSHPNYDSSQSWDPLGEILYPDPPREASLQESSDSGNCNGEYPIVVLHPELALENTSAPQVMFCDIILTPAFRTLLSIDNSPFRNAFLTQPPATSVMVAGKMIEDEAGITFAHVVGAYKRQLAQFQPRRPKTAYHRRLLSKKRLPSTVAQASRFWEDMGILAGVEKWELIIWDVVPDISGHVEAAGDGSQNSMYKGVTMPLIECEERTYKVRGSAVEVKWCVCGKGWE